MSYVGKVTAGGTTHLVGSTLYGTCATAAATAQKDVTCSDFDELITGATIHVKFTYSNTAATPTLKVGSTAAKNIYKYGTTKPGTTAATSWQAGSIISFTYDGSYWIMNDHLDDTNTQTVSSVAGKTGAVTLTSSDVGLGNVENYKAVNIAGDTMTGNLKVHGTAGVSIAVESEFCTIGNTSNNKVTTQRYIGFNMRDSEDYTFGQCVATAGTDGHTETYIQVYNKKTDGAQVVNQIRAQVTKAGAQTYYVTSAANFRSAIGAAASSSDRRLKTEISEVPDDLIKAVCECDIYQFKIMNDEPTNKFAIGIIAQDLVANCEKYNVDINDYEMVGLEKTRSTEDIDYYTINYFHYLTIKSLYYDRKIARLEEAINDLIQRGGK